MRKSRTSGDDHSGNKSTRLHACSEEPLHYVLKLVRKHKKVPNSTLWTRIEHILVMNPCNYKQSYAHALACIVTIMVEMLLNI